MWAPVLTALLGSALVAQADGSAGAIVVGVRTVEELQQAVRDGSRHVVIQEHLVMPEAFPEEGLDSQISPADSLVSIRVSLPA